MFRRVNNCYFEYQFSNGSILTFCLLSVDTWFAGVFNNLSGFAREIVKDYFSYELSPYAK